MVILNLSGIASITFKGIIDPGQFDGQETMFRLGLN